MKYKSRHNKGRERYINTTPLIPQKNIIYLLKRTIGLATQRKLQFYTYCQSLTLLRHMSLLIMYTSLSWNMSSNVVTFLH